MQPGRNVRILTASERVDRAFATLGLRRDVSAEKAQQEYRRLVRRWHPDRYTGDPQGHAEASLRMRQINAAFDVIRPLLQPAPQPATAAPVPPVTPVETPRHEAREFGSRL